MITIDGSSGEGGGQMLRTALALSTLTGKAFEMINVRGGKAVPGLKNQHLYTIKAFEKLCDATVEGAEFGSSYVKFYPGKIKPRTISIDVETAGSITLILQSLLIPSVFADGKIRFKIKGGTDTRWSMPIDYFTQVFLPQLRRFADIEYTLERRGYFPIGGGRFDITIKSKNPIHALEGTPAFELSEQGRLMQIEGISHAANPLAKGEVAERQASSAKLELGGPMPLAITSGYIDSDCVGSGITLYAIFSRDGKDTDFLNPMILGADALGEKGVRAEDVGRGCAKKLKEEMGSGAAVDSHLADNLIPYLAIIGGSIKTSEITGHTRTNIAITEMFLPAKFGIDEEKRIISLKKQDL